MKDTFLDAILSMALAAALGYAYFKSLNDDGDEDVARRRRPKINEGEIHAMLVLLYTFEVVLRLGEALQHVHVSIS